MTMKFELEIRDTVVKTAATYHSLIGGEWNTEGLKGTLEWLLVKGAESVRESIDQNLDTLFKELGEIE
jgi:hypothetical protein